MDSLAIKVLSIVFILTSFSFFPTPRSEFYTVCLEYNGYLLVLRHQVHELSLIPRPLSASSELSKVLSLYSALPCYITLHLHTLLSATRHHNHLQVPDTSGTKKIDVLAFIHRIMKSPRLHSQDLVTIITQIHTLPTSFVNAPNITPEVTDFGTQNTKPFIKNTDLATRNPTLQKKNEGLVLDPQNTGVPPPLSTTTLKTPAGL